MVHEIVRTTTKSTTDRHIGDHSFTGIVSVLRAAIHLAAARGQSLDIKDWDEIEKLLIPFSERWGVGGEFSALLLNVMITLADGFSTTSQGIYSTQKKPPGQRLPVKEPRSDDPSRVSKACSCGLFV